MAHALLEHLSQPGAVINEIKRVLKPRGVAALCSPDWGGFLLMPDSGALTTAIEVYMDLQTMNGGDPFAGRKLLSMLEGGGLQILQTSARYETYASTTRIAEYLATQLDEAGESAHAMVLRDWGTRAGSVFAQAWVSCVGRIA